MSGVLFVIQATSDTSTHSTRAALSMVQRAAGLIKNTYDILVLANTGGKRLASELSHFGARQVILLEHSEFDVNIPETLLESAAAVAGAYSLVVATADLSGLDLMPRIAGRLDAGYVAECSAVALSDGQLKLQRSMYAGNISAWVTLDTSVQVVTVRSTGFAPAEPIATESPVILGQHVPPGRAATQVTCMELAQTGDAYPKLTEARIIVSGGRYLKGKFFHVLTPLAKALGAVVGATRAACIAGFAPFDCQVGQTGNIVNPEVYLAIGISGSVQHMAGIKGAKTIIAINKDPQAAIFRWADYGLVADMFTAVPELVKYLQEVHAAPARPAGANTSCEVLRATSD